MKRRCVYVNRLISDLYKKVGSHFYIKESATYKLCLVMRLNVSSHAMLLFKFEYYFTSHTAVITLSISKSILV